MTVRGNLVALMALAASLVLVPNPAQADQQPPAYSDTQIQELIEYAFEVLPHLESRTEEPSVTGDASVDERIWQFAYERGYELQPAAIENQLVVMYGDVMQERAADAWGQLYQAASAAGHDIAITSAHRGVEEQTSLFNSRLDGTSEAAIVRTLRRAAPPGASRHHTGYVFDLSEVGDDVGIFGQTESYDWLAAANYRNAMLFGFLPSYPPGITDAGPEPEPWEWVYVGRSVIFHDGPFWDILPNHLFATSIEWLSSTNITRGCSSDGEFFCPGLNVDRGQMAAFLNRALDLPGSADDHFDDDSSSIFELDINAIAAAGITRGCNPPENTRYCAEEVVDRGAMAAFLSRALSLAPTSIDYFYDDDGSVFESDINSLASAGITRGCGERRYCPTEPLTRAEMAAMLYRARERLP